MEIDGKVKMAIYGHFAATGNCPSAKDVAAKADIPIEQVPDVLAQLRAQRVLVLEPDGSSIRMAPPFSGVPTQHRVSSSGVSYFANCAWDALGVAAALRRPSTVHSRCEQSREPLELEVGDGGPADSDWVFHSVVPAAKWWDDIVFT
jgi:hypothetical protein